MGRVRSRLTVGASVFCPKIAQGDLLAFDARVLDSSAIDGPQALSPECGSLLDDG